MYPVSIHFREYMDIQRQTWLVVLMDMSVLYLSLPHFHYWMVVYLYILQFLLAIEDYRGRK